MANFIHGSICGVTNIHPLFILPVELEVGSVHEKWGAANATGGTNYHSNFLFGTISSKNITHISAFGDTNAERDIRGNCSPKSLLKKSNFLTLLIINLQTESYISSRTQRTRLRLLSPKYGVVNSPPR